MITTIFSANPAPLQKLTELESFTEERTCASCSSKICPGRNLIQSGQTANNTTIDEYPCFIKAQLLVYLPTDTVRELLLENRLLHYIGVKTQAVVRTSSRRGSYGNLGTLLVIIEDYLNHIDAYEDYDGMQFSDYLARIRSIPGCSKVQNHSINHRLNQEFKKKFNHDNKVPIERVPILGGTGTTYKIDEDLLLEKLEGIESSKFAKYLLEILSFYFYFREGGNLELIEKCEKMMEDPVNFEGDIIEFLENAMTHHDARMFEISAFVVLKEKYSTKKIIWGDNHSNLEEVPLKLYKTGRVSANDGGIDYVLTPLGKYFQATQNFNFTKYFLDIDKLTKFPISFVIQTEMSAEEALEKIRSDAKSRYEDPEVLKRYIDSFDEIYTLKDLREILVKLRNLPEKEKAEKYRSLLDEFITQYSVEYNLT